MRALDPNSMDILNALIYEDDLHIGKNKYSFTKMNFLMDQLGDAFCMKNLSGIPLKIWFLLKNRNYDFYLIKIADVKNQLGVTWSMEGVMDISKKIQKQLEIAWLSRMNEFDDIYSEENQLIVSKYEDIFKKSIKHHRVELEKVIENSLNHKLIHVDDAIIYNEEAAKIKNFFEKQLRNIQRDSLSADIGLNIINECRKNINVTNTKSQNKFQTVIEKLKDYKVKYKDDSIKQCRHTSDKLKAIFIYNISMRTIIDKEDLKKQQIEYYTSLLNNLNVIYGYERYKA